LAQDDGIGHIYDNPEKHELEPSKEPVRLANGMTQKKTKKKEAADQDLTVSS
jgi:hypothetical protein